WARAATPLRAFLQAETGGAAVLLAAALAALVWANVDSGSYDSVWTTELSIRLGHWSVSEDLRHWVNDGLMTFFFFVIGLEARRARHGGVYFVLGVATWVAVLKSGVDPVIVGLAFGLLTYAYPAGREDLERASDLFRLFREQPTPELARDARSGVASAISPNERLQQMYHPWSSYVIVPLFALANAGIVLGGGFLSRALGSP